MSINRFTQRQAAQFDPYTPPLDVLQGALQMKQTQYDKYYALADELGQTKINALKADRARANTIIRGYNDRIEKVSQEYGGDYSRMGKDLLSLTRQIKRDFAPGGEAHAIEYNYSDYQKWLERQQEALAKGTIQASQINLGSKYILDGYTGVGDVNPETGTYNRLQTEEIAAYTDLNELVTEYSEGVVPHMVSTGEWVPYNNKLWIKGKVGIEEVTAERIEQAVMLGLGSNRKYQEYASQMGRFGSPVTQQELNMAVQRGVTTYAFRNVEKDMDFKYDKKWLIDYENDLDKQNMFDMRFMQTRQTENQVPTMHPDKFLERPSSGVIPYFNPLVPTLSTIIHLPSRTIGKAGDDPIKPGEQILANAGHLIFNLGVGGGIFGGLSDVLFPVAERSFEETMQDPQTHKKHGVLLGTTYKQLTANYPGWNKLDDNEKKNILTENYNRVLTETVNTTRDMIIPYGTKTQVNTTKGLLRSGAFKHLAFSVKDKNNRFITGLSAEEAASYAGTTVDKIMDKAQAHGEVMPITDSRPAVVIDTPGASGTLYAHGYDIRTDNAAKPLLYLSKSIMDPEVTESEFVPIPGLTTDENPITYSVSTSYDFDEKGSFEKMNTTWRASIPTKIDEQGNVLESKIIPLPNFSMETAMGAYNRALGNDSFTHKIENTKQY
jgi:hypothetical protein